jgi:CDP-4-dehydro-6-deoxyglucose reductase
MRFRVSRDQIPWHPTVDSEKCTGCKTCFEFCSHGTYTWDEQNGRPIVTKAVACVVGCSSCAAQCPSEAIKFPPLSILRQYM